MHTAAFIAALFVISLGSGAAAMALPRLIPLPRRSRFLAGLSLTPVLIGLWAGLAALPLPLAAKPFVLLAPVFAGLLSVVSQRRRLAKLWRLEKKFALRQDWPVKLSYACCAVLVCAVACKLAVNAHFPVDGSDALQYMYEAASVADSSADPLSSLIFRNRYDRHNFVWPSYLSYAFMWGGAEIYPRDLAARIALQATFLYMLISFFALSGVFRLPGLGALGVIIFLQVPQLSDISYAADRDGFRIVPLLVMGASFLALSQARQKRTAGGGSFWMAVCALLAFSGHAINAVLFSCLLGAWTAWSLTNGAGTRVLPPVCGVLAGMALAGVHHVVRYFQSGGIL